MKNFKIEWWDKKTEQIVPKRFKIQMVLFYVLLLLSNSMRAYEGEDILAARESFSSAQPIDIWGAFPGLFYSIIPSWPVDFSKSLIALQLSLTLYSVLKIRSLLWLENKGLSAFFTAISVISLYFSTYLTRDSTMFSFLIFGVALISQLTLNSSHLAKCFSVAPILVGMSFRPWLSVIGAIIIFIAMPSNRRDNRFRGTAIALVVIVSPFLINQGSYLANSELRKVHPEMQVIAMDLASIKCLGIDEGAREDATDVLKLFLKPNESISTNFCNTYRTNTWQSIGEWQFSEDDPIKLQSDLRSTETDKVRLSAYLPKKEFTEIRSAWLQLLSDYPRDYAGVKILQAAQLSVGGDSATLLPRIHGKLSELTHQMLYLPFSIVIHAHLLSTVMLFCLMLAVFPLISGEISRLNKRKYLASFLIPIVWLLISTIAYIGDNGRYIYSSTILFYILILTVLFKNSKVIK